MISRRHRFHGHNSLSFVYKQGKMVRGGQLALKYAPNSRRKIYRVAVVVSRKVSKSAVVRNRIRRRIYEVVRASDAAITLPYDLVFTVFSDQLASLSATELQQQVLGELRKAGVLATEKPAPHDIVKPKDRG
jgi:ribonuclease P protein component